MTLSNATVLTPLLNRSAQENPEEDDKVQPLTWCMSIHLFKC